MQLPSESRHSIESAGVPLSVGPIGVPSESGDIGCKSGERSAEERVRIRTDNLMFKI